MNLSPYIKCTCPSCFEEIYLGECAIVSGITSGKVLKTASKGIFARMNVEPLEGRKYTLELARRQCTSCGYLLPPNIEQVPAITLAVIGDTFSGKSHYIASLIYQIKSDWIGNIQGFARFTSMTPEVENNYRRDYLDPLFRDKQMLPPTQPARISQARREPLIYKLAVSPSPKHPPKTINLMIYDAAGEDFESADRLVQVARFVLHTNAFIFVADPFAMAPIFQKLPGALQVQFQRSFQLSQGRRPAERLNAVIEIFERFRGAQTGSSLPDIPVAIMLSKADLLSTLPPRPYTNRPYTFMSNPQYGGELDVRDLDTVDQEVRELLQMYGQRDLLSATSRFRQKKFFATSATGEPPDGQGNFTNVEPTRCLDPVLWILYQMQLIRANL